jgi:hypothetical protein
MSLHNTVRKLLSKHFVQSVITTCLLRPNVTLSGMFSNPFNLRFSLRGNSTFIPMFSPASRNEIQTAFLSCQQASNYLIYMQVKGQAVSVDFGICIDPSTCQNEEDDGSVFATKNHGSFKPKNLKEIFMVESVKRVHL